MKKIIAAALFSQSFFFMNAYAGEGIQVDKTYFDNPLELSVACNGSGRAVLAFDPSFENSSFASPRDGDKVYLLKTFDTCGASPAFECSLIMGLPGSSIEGRMYYIGSNFICRLPLLKKPK